MSVQVDMTILCDQWRSHVWHPPHTDITAPITRAVKHTIALFDIGICEVSVVLADDPFVQDLNARYRNKNTPTNVLSFPARDSYMMADMIDTLGDVVLSFDTVIAEAKQQQKPALNHCIHLVVHGTLHLLGMDHGMAAEAEKMENTERQILKKLGIDNPHINA